jgi:hypothetical protein
MVTIQAGKPGVFRGSYWGYACERIAAEGLPRAAEWDSQFKAAVEAAVADRTTMHNLAQSFEDFQATMNESYRLSLLLRLVKLRKG